MNRWRVLVALLVVLAACGGGGDGGDGNEAVTTSTSRAPTTVTEPPTTTTTIDLDERPARAASPAELASQVTQAEAVVRDTSITGDALARAGHVQQVAYRTLADHPEWDAAVLATLPEHLRTGTIANVEANRQLRALVKTPKPTLPAWRIVPAAPADDLRRHYQEGEAQFGVPWEYLAAVNLVETRMGRLRGTSTAGAQGPMQFIPGTWEAYGEGDINDDRDAILAAARYLAANGGGRGDLANALYRYNPTPKYVTAVTNYAEQMVADERAYRGYYHWQVYYWSTLGDVWLRVGWSSTESRPVTPADLE